jgi:curli biogenesis system outer membrane secretion channel CsgG
MQVLTQKSLIEGKMRNYYFRWLTSLIILSVFTSLLGISTAKTVNAEDKSVSPDIHKQNCSIPTQFTSSKLRIAVADFTIVATSLNNRSLSSNEEKVTRIADIIASKLAKDSNFIVIERTQIEPIYKKNRQLCKIRRQFGVEAILIGSLTQFDIKKRTSGGGFLGFGKTTTNTNADVELNIRIINTATGEIIDSFTENGSTNFSESNVEVPSVNVRVINDDNYTNTVTSRNDFVDDIYSKNGTEFRLSINTNQKEKISHSSTENEGSLMTSATKKAISNIVQKLNANSDKFVSVLRKLDNKNSLVVGTFGNFIVLNLGKLHGYRQGMKLRVEEITETFVDPHTKEVIRTFTLPIARIELIDVDDKSSLAKIISGNTNTILFSEEIKKQIEKGNIIAKPIN